MIFGEWGPISIPRVQLGAFAAGVDALAIDDTGDFGDGTFKLR